MPASVTKALLLIFATKLQSSTVTLNFVPGFSPTYARIWSALSIRWGKALSGTVY